jgi:hypothetical protein
MGVPTGGGTNLGNAQGRITIDTSGVRRAQREVDAASRQMSQTLQQLGGAFGLTFGAAGLAQIARFAVQADGVATAFRRQGVAALSLAGSQQQLNDLMRVYDSVTGGAIDKATALSDVTRLMAVGFGDSAAELEEFVRAARGISVATGQQQDYVISQLQLAIANQSTMRLDQLGLGVSEVKRRIDELKASNRGLTDEMAYQQAILGLATEKFGALTDSAEAQATGVEKLRKAWKDFQLEMGQSGGPAINAFAEGATKELQGLQDKINGLIRDINRLRDAMDGLNQGREQRLANASPIERFLSEAVDNWLRANDIGDLMRQTQPRTPPRGIGESPWLPSVRTAQATAVAPRFTDDQTSAIADWAREVQEIERQAANDRISATRQYEAQRAQVIRDYGKSIAREAEDFARQRARAEEDYALNLQRIHRDIAQREAQQAADLERTIGDARADAAERAADRQADLEERLAETRANTQERIAELEADYNKRRERAAEDHRDRIEDAAGRLDAIGVREAQKNFARSQRDAKEDFDERLEKERKNEAKRLEELNKAHAKQTADEQAALEKRISQAQEAYQRQIDAARIADAQRLEDMADDFALRKEREDEDRATRLERMAEDHADQLAEMARQHMIRMAEIDRQEAEELQSANDAFDAQMAELDVYHAGYLEQQQGFQSRSLVLYQQYLDALEAEVQRRMAIQGPAPLNPMITPGGWPSIGGTSSVAPSSISNSRIVTVAPGAVVVYGAIGQSEESIGEIVREQLAVILEQLID